MLFTITSADARVRTAVSTGDVPVFSCLLDAQRVASVETHAETQETIQWKKKTCNVLKKTHNRAAEHFIYSLYFMIKVWTHVRNLQCLKIVYKKYISWNAVKKCLNRTSFKTSFSHFN